ncbi:MULTISPECIES: glycosyltransferase family 4 protein [Idiomarina]|uniref:glycosyltransferase family 4 protein n=1 Tax=Idiomarina TaxID=135575 RepID=UPI000C4EBD10|nr:MULTISPECIES: glycosyltransferase family 4 protein [Idiomarina]MBP59137.1 glycosyl transferase [Idiomarina sp.]
MKKVKVIHVSTVHKRYDTRIFEKEVKSSSNFGYDSCLVVADGHGNEVKDGIDIFDIGMSPSSRFRRIFRFANQVYNFLLKFGGDVYHLHDPELITVGLKLKKAGFKVIFDSHENVSDQILLKEYIPKYLRSLIARIYSVYERIASRKLDAVVAATPGIYEKFESYGCNVHLVRNFPIVEEFSSINKVSSGNVATFIGTIERDRGLLEVVESLKYSRGCYTIKVAGGFSYKEDESIFFSATKDKSVDYLGWLDRRGVSQLLSESSVGLVTLHPTITFKDSLPVKLFEYMAAGIPVLASDFPLWKSIISTYQCGICVNPLNPKEVARALDFMFDNPNEAKLMGERGKQVVQTIFNWKKESESLKLLYDDLQR